MIKITIAKNPTHDYPFAVVIDRGQELLCRSTRDALLVANGTQGGLMHAGVSGSRIEWDERLERPR